MNDYLQQLAADLQVYSIPIFKSFLVLLVGILVFTIFNRALQGFAANGYLDYQLRVILRNLAKWLMLIIVILITLGFFGVSVGTLWATLSGVIALFALGFVAVWSVLSNIMCSVLLIIFAPFRIGDEIEIQEPTSEFFLRGKVISINMMFTSLQVSGANPDETEATLLRVPNNIFFQKYVRCIPGKRTESLKRYTARQQEQD